VLARGVVAVEVTLADASGKKRVTLKVEHL
jgi:hypothetical protein